MSLSAAEKTQLTLDVQVLVDHITALVVDPDVNPLQAELDAANAALATAQADNTALLAKIQSAKDAIAAADIADTAEDAARAAALAALQ